MTAPAPRLAALPAQAQDWVWAQRAGGTDSDFGAGVAVDAAGDTYVTGSFEGTATFGSQSLTGAGDRDVFVVKYTHYGEVLWAQRGGGGSFDYGSGVGVDAAGNAYVTGSVYGYRGTTWFGSLALYAACPSTAFLVKYAPSGDVLWAQLSGRGTGGQGTEGRGVGAEPGGGIYVTGRFSNRASFGLHVLTGDRWGEVFIAKFDPSAPPPLVLDAAPVDPPVVIPPGGGAFSYTVTVTNPTDQPQTFQAWTAVTAPAYQLDALGPRAFTLPAGTPLTRTITQQVPPASPPARTRTTSSPAPRRAASRPKPTSRSKRRRAPSRRRRPRQREKAGA